MKAKSSALTFCLLAIATIPVPGQAQTTLQWRLAAGQKFVLEVHRETASEVAYAGKKTTTNLDLTMSVNWEVLAANAETMRIKQSLAKVIVTMESPSVGRVEYDSSAATKPTGRARDLAAAVAPLLNASLELEMNARGEITSAKLAGPPTDKAATSAGTPDLSAFSSESIQQLLKQPLLVLPEKPVQLGAEWTSHNELATSLGPASQTTTYRYRGPVEEDGVKLEKIDQSSTLDVKASESTKTRLKQHQHTGSFLFSSAEHRLVSAEQSQTLITERPYRETTIIITLTSKQSTKLKLN